MNDAPNTSDISGLNELKNYETATYSVTGSPNSTYIWIAYGGGAVTAGGNTNTATVKWGAANATTAVIRVRETNSSNCKGVVKELYVNVKSNIGVSEQFNQLGNVSLFPNPANKLVNLKFDLFNNADAMIEIVDVLGKKQFVQTNTISNKELLPIDISDLKAGVYFVNVTINQNKKVLRLVVE